MRIDVLLRRAVKDPLTMTTLDLPEWDRLLQLARASNLLSRLACDAVDRALLPMLPAAVRPHLTAAARLAAHQSASIQRECRRIEAALGDLGVPVLLLKGAAYAARRLVAARGRLYGDIDLLVPRAALGQVEARLQLHGWAIGAIDPYDLRYYRQWMHELPPMTHLQRGTVIDLHHNILPLTARNAPDATALLEASEALPGSALRTLSMVDMVIHSSVHLFHEGDLKNGLRDLFDLHSLISECAHGKPAFWAQLLRRAVDLGLVWPLHLALRWTHRLVGTPVPDDVLTAAAAEAGIGRARQALLDAAYTRAFEPAHPLLARPSVSAARLALFVRAHWLRMPWPLLVRHLGRKALMRTVMHTSRRLP